MNIFLLIKGYLYLRRCNSEPNWLSFKDRMHMYISFRCIKLFVFFCDICFILVVSNQKPQYLWGLMIFRIFTVLCYFKLTLIFFYFLNFKIFNSYMHSQTWTPLPPPSPQHLSGSSPCRAWSFYKEVKASSGTLPSPQECQLCLGGWNL